MMENKIYTINSLKYDGSIHHSWSAEILDETSELISFKGVFEKEVKHSKLDVIRPGTVSYEFYWKNRWYNIFRFHEPEGELRNFYCNINKPPEIEKNALSYVDLDLDVLVRNDLSFESLDADEFEENAKKFDYPVELRRKAMESLREVIALIKNKAFPFDYEP
jgi:protein associated with RNAse G/E